MGQKKPPGGGRGWNDADYERMKTGMTKFILGLIAGFLVGIGIRIFILG